MTKLIKRIRMRVMMYSRSISGAPCDLNESILIEENPFWFVFIGDHSFLLSFSLSLSLIHLNKNREETNECMRVEFWWFHKRSKIKISFIRTDSMNYTTLNSKWSFSFRPFLDELLIKLWRASIFYSLVEICNNENTSWLM